MAIARDVETIGTAFTSTGTQTVSHAGSASARGACVLIDQNGTTADEVSGVTYAGVAMTRLRFDTEATEAGAVYIYWLDGVVTGTQDVKMTTTAATNKQMVIATMTVTSGNSVAVAGNNSGTSASASNPSWTISGLTAASVLAAYEVIHSGLQTMTTTPAASWTLISSTDLGAEGRGFARQSVASSGTTLACGWTAATADDFVGSSVAFIQGPPATSAVAGLASGTGSAPGASVPPAPPVIQSASHQVTSGNCSVTLPKNVQAGTKIIAYLIVSISQPTDPVTSVKDVAGNTWTRLKAVEGSASDQWQEWFALDTPAGDVGGTVTLTATIGATNFGVDMLVQEVSELLAGNTTAMLDGTPSSNSASSTGPATSSAYSSAAAGEFLVAVCTDPGFSRTITDSSGYNADRSNINGSSTANIIVDYKASAGGAESASFALSGTDEWLVFLGAFQLASTGTSASAGLASGTGTAPAPAVTLAANATPGNAAGTGTAPQPVAQVAKTAAAGAAGTGTAPAPAVTTVSHATPGLASGTGTAPAPAVTLAANATAGLAAATGTAPGVTAQTSAGTTANAGLASGTGTAPAPSLTLAASAAPPAATGTGTAPAPAVTLAASAAAGNAAGTGTAPRPALTLAANATAGVASGTGTAPGVTASTTSNTQAAAGLAAGTGTAPAPAVTAASHATPGLAAGTGTAPGITAQVARSAIAGLAAGTGTAPVVALTLAANAQALAALATGTAPGASGTGNVPSVVARSTATVTAAVTSTATATDPRDGASTVTAAVTSTPAVSDPRDGTAAVAAVTTSSPTVT